MRCPLYHRIPRMIPDVLIGKPLPFPPIVKGFAGVHIVGSGVIAFIPAMLPDPHPHLAAQRSAIFLILLHMRTSIA